VAGILGVHCFFPAPPLVFFILQLWSLHTRTTAFTLTLTPKKRKSFNSMFACSSYYSLLNEAFAVRRESRNCLGKANSTDHKTHLLRFLAKCSLILTRQMSSGKCTMIAYEKTCDGPDH
jgi:hypothetical protein